MFKEQATPAALLVERSTPALQAVTTNPEPPVNGAAESPTMTVAIVSSDPAGSTTLRHMLMQTGVVKDIQEWASTKSVELRSAQEVPDFIFLDLSGDRESDFAFSQHLIKLRPSAHIAICSANPQTNPEFLLQAMRSGVRDFLLKPYDRIDIASTINRVNSERSNHSPKRALAGKLLAVLGTKGGVGSSTVAVNVAVQLAQIPRKSTILLDFSRPLGDIAALLDLKPSFQLRDALINFKRLDATLLKGLLTNHRSGLQVLAGAAQLGDWDHGSFSAIERLVEVAQQTFDFVVMDLGSFY